MKNNQSKEDYLEAILILSRELDDVHQIEVARKLGVSQPAVQKALKILKAESLIDTDGLHIYLTENGKAYAENVYHRHCAIGRFLVKLGVNEADAYADACVMEHCVSEATFQAIEKFIGEKDK